MNVSHGLLLTLAYASTARAYCYYDEFNNYHCTNALSNAARVGIGIAFFFGAILLISAAVAHRRRTLQRRHMAFVVTTPAGAYQPPPQAPYGQAGYPYPPAPPYPSAPYTSPPNAAHDGYGPKDAIQYPQPTYAGNAPPYAGAAYPASPVQPRGYDIVVGVVYAQTPAPETNGPLPSSAQAAYAPPPGPPPAKS
ncbi:hypothetical protein AURDEDRAFT_154607 [Auricularia subglabra TFB-10046 SS5]|uniref:MARVEL domain-containing protein n=1 Tax=Auricularia subglabra (strain TFB-10046 / SS5) TaxID=717982 RepID=J0WUP1_AURST|nr:hypothetical protein AURDEDRAFT_154607 [Auricularia subglabra TFB-10046 SS5]